MTVFHASAMDLRVARQDQDSRDWVTVGHRTRPTDVSQPSSTTNRRTNFNTGYLYLPIVKCNCFTEDAR